MLPPCLEQELSELLARKEEEWRALQAQRALLQEAALQEAQHRLEEAQGKLQRLQEDFVYNLQVLEERDRELQRYDAEFAQARRREEAGQAEASELRIEVAKLRRELSREARHTEELQHQLQLTLQEHRLELERVHSDKNSEVDQQREQCETLKWKLERTLKEFDSELALQRQELLLEFESEMRRREHEFQLRAEDMSNAVLTKELELKQLNKELRALREAGAQAAESLRKAETEHLELERKLQGRAQELQDLEAVKDARIKVVEEKLHSERLTRKRAEETLRRKCEELDRQAMEKDAVLAAVKGAHAGQLQALEATVLELQAHCETLEGQLSRAERMHADDAREKKALIERLRDDAAAVKAAWDAQIDQMSKDAVSKDLQVQMLQEEGMKLKAQVARFQQDIDRYKQQLALAVEKEQSLERAQVQLCLDWQHRCDDVERDQIQRSETLIQGLTKARDQVAAKLQETERALRQQEALLEAVSLERDQAMDTLRTHGVLAGPQARVPAQQREGEMRKDFPSSEIQRLQEQNAGLRNAVAQMRREMEMLSGHLPPAHSEERLDAGPDPKAGGDSAPPDYVLALEAEMQNLKDKIKALEEQLQGMEEPVKTSLTTADPHPGACGSAEAAGLALTDQESTALALRKLGDRVHLLNLLLTQLRKKLRHRPLELGTVQHELPREVGQVHLEVSELQQQVAELRKHLTMAGPQREPPHRQQLQREGLADWRPVGMEDQTESPSFPLEGAQPLQTLSVPHLQRKLKDAARKILSLHLEREQLLEMGNRLRAELGHPKGNLPHGPPPPTSEPQDALEVPEKPSGHRPPLGQLQLHSTAQDPRHTERKCVSEYAQKSQPHSAQAVSKDNSPRGRKAGTASRPAQKPHRAAETWKSADQKENRPPRAPQAPTAPEESGCCTHTSSPLASSSLQGTWRPLDLGSSLPGVPSQGGSASGRRPACLIAPHRGSGAVWPHRSEVRGWLVPSFCPLALRGCAPKLLHAPDCPGRLS